VYRGGGGGGWYTAYFLHSKKPKFNIKFAPTSMEFSLLITELVHLQFDHIRPIRIVLVCNSWLKYIYFKSLALLLGQTSYVGDIDGNNF
jgi:hypothetical protein